MSPRRTPAPRAPAIDGARLMAEAERARLRAYAPYSRFKVGAALLTASGRIIHGCNVENASFGLSICAERTAVFKAIGEGERDFVAIAVTAEPKQSASPCGACRQVLHEFAPDLRVFWRVQGGRVLERPLRALLDHAFDFERSAPRAGAGGGAKRRARRPAPRRGGRR